MIATQLNAEVQGPALIEEILATWDLGEVERDWEEKIVSQIALVNNLPSFSRL
jgi:hypothetical protein